MSPQLYYGITKLRISQHFLLAILTFGLLPGELTSDGDPGICIDHFYFLSLALDLESLEYRVKMWIS